jgi:hypothetical protein
LVRLSEFLALGKSPGLMIGSVSLDEYTLRTRLKEKRTQPTPMLKANTYRKSTVRERRRKGVTNSKMTMIKIAV